MIEQQARRLFSPSDASDAPQAWVRRGAMLRLRPSQDCQLMKAFDVRTNAEMIAVMWNDATCLQVTTHQVSQPNVMSTFRCHAPCPFTGFQIEKENNGLILYFDYSLFH